MLKPTSAASAEPQIVSEKYFGYCYANNTRVYGALGFSRS